MKIAAALIAILLLAFLPAQAGLVNVEIRGTVEYNQVRAPASFNRDVVHAGDNVVVSFQVDSNDYTDGSNFPTRGYVVVHDSYRITFYSSTGPVTVPFPTPYPFSTVPYFVIRNNDPAVDGFFVSSSDLDYPYPSLYVDQPARFQPYFEQYFLATYPGDRLPSLDIYDAVGYYDYTGLQVFGFSMVDAGLDAMYIDYTDMTISRVPTPVPIDLRPGSCPNPINPRSKGVLPVAILGTDTLDVANIDPASIRLNGVPPLRSSYEDVGTPFDPYVGRTDCVEDCNADGPDGYRDLVLKFDTQAVAAALNDAHVTPGSWANFTCTTVTLTGYFYEDYDSGGPIIGEDVAKILKDAPASLVGTADRLGQEKTQGRIAVPLKK
jgi:hypothetical protein